MNNDGTFPSGYLIITANDEFEYTESASRRMVSTEDIMKTFTSGLLDAIFTIAPTINASQDKTNLYYTVQFFTPSRKWTEYWTIDAAGASTLEITSITKVIVNPVASTVDYIPSDDVSIEPIASGIPRAGADGLIDAGWIIGASGTFVYSFTDTDLGHPLGAPPSGVLLAIGYDAIDDQSYVWAGGRWRVTG